MNNGAAALLLVLTALARGRRVVVSRGELVEIGGGFRVPDVMAQSGALLEEVGTTNRTRLADYRDAVAGSSASGSAEQDVAFVLKVHQSNYRIVGFTESVDVAALVALGPPVVVDIGSGLLDASTPWLEGGPPGWLAGEPAARQTLAAGAALVTFSGDKLLGGPQAGVIAGRADLVAACARHPLSRALRPGGLVLAALQETALAYLRRDGMAIPFWRMAAASVDDLMARAEALGVGRPVRTVAVAGGGSVPGQEVPSAGVAVEGDHAAALRAHDPPIVARVVDGGTVCDLRTVDPADDAVLATGPRPGWRPAARCSARRWSVPHVNVVATAGHVDHGKSTLVLALTGMDPDRFAEEKERGLTIDLGFAWTTLPSGRQLAFVDVPGHVRFLKNMLAGVGAVEACLFVVAATEGWKPQSEEHLRILELLGVGHGLVALTKVGLVDAETRELARLELADMVAGTFLEGSEVVEVDVPAGEGVDDLRAALDRLLAVTPAAVDRARPRLWIDRVFAARGSGTVVTGTLAGGPLAVDDELVACGRGGRGDRKVRVRGLQSLQRAQVRVEPGSRVAVNLSGVARDELARGDALVRPRQWRPTRLFDGSLRTLAALGHDVGRRGAYQLYVGSGEHPVQLRVLGAGDGSPGIAPGDEGMVRLRLPVAVPLLPGDRYILRESGRDETVGGGEVLDVSPVLPLRRAHPSRSVERVVAERGWVLADELERLTGERRKPQVGRWVVAPGALDEAESELRAAVEAAGPLGLDVAGLDERRRAVLAGLDGVVVDGGRARMGTAADPLAGHPYVTALEAGLFSPPDPDGVDRAELSELVRRGLVVERDGAYFGPLAVAEAARRLAAALMVHPDGLTVAQVRDALGTTRKHALPLLAHLDATGVTRRRGDLRIAGPRMPKV